MSEHSININVNHTGGIGGSSGGGSTTAENIGKDYSVHLQDLTRSISELNNHFKNTTSSMGGGAFANSANASQSKAAMDQQNQFHEAFNPAVEDFRKAIDEFNKGQSESNARLMKMSAIMSVPILAGASKFASAYAQGGALAAGNDLTNPVGYASAQLEASYNKKGAAYLGAGGLIGGAIGSRFGAAGAAYGAGVGAAAGSSINELLNLSDLRADQLEVQKSQTSTQLLRGNATGGVLSGLYQKTFSDPSNYGMLANQVPYLGGVNSYRGNMSESDLTGVAKFGKKYGLEGEQAGQAGVLLSQIASYMGDMSTTLHEIDQYQSQYGGDTIQQLSALSNYLQAGAAPKDSLNAAYKSGYQGSGFQNAQSNYYNSDWATRARQEVFSNTLGFSASRHMRGEDTAEEAKRIRNLQARRAMGFGASGSDLYAGHYMDALTEGAGIGYLQESAPMPTGRSAGTYESFPLSTGERQGITDKMKTLSDSGNKNQSEDLYVVKHHIKAMDNLTKAVNNNTNAINKVNKQ